MRSRWPWMACWTRRRQRSSASPARRTTWKRSITATAVGISSAAAVLKPVKPSIATTATASRHVLSRSASQVLKTCLERPSTMSSRRAGPVPARTAVRSMIPVTYLSPRLVWRHNVLVDADGGDAVEPGGVVDRDALAFGQDGVVGGVPGDPEPFGDPGDGEVMAHDRLQCPPQAATRQLRPRLGRLRGVLAPDVAAACALVAADTHEQRRRSPAEWLVRDLSGAGVAGSALAAAASAPALGAVVGVDDSAGEDGAVGFEVLAAHGQAELVEPAELGQVRAREGSVRQVEVFRMASVRTPILGRPRRLSEDRHASAHHTLICEEPVIDRRHGVGFQASSTSLRPTYWLHVSTQRSDTSESRLSVVVPIRGPGSRQTRCIADPAAGPHHHGPW